MNISKMLVTWYQFCHALHVWMWILVGFFVLCVKWELLQAFTDHCVAQAVQPVDQVNPSSRRDTTACDWAGVAGTVGPYPDEACQSIQAYLAEDGEEEGEVALGPHSANPHGGPAWACKVGRKLPSCLWEEGEESTTHSCISYMQLTLNMH